MSTPLVVFKNIDKRFGTTKALDDVSFSIEQGEIFGYIGPNGAGKTTSIKLLVGLLHADSGTLDVQGHSMPEGKAEVHKNVGYLSQNTSFQTWRTVEHALTTFGRLSGVPRAELDARITQVLERVNLADARNKRVGHLSGGMVRRLGLAQAILHKPLLLVLDEPLAALDPANRGQVKSIIEELAGEGTTILFSSHILSDVQDIAHRVGILDHGRIVRVGTLEALKEEFSVGHDLKVRLSRPTQAWKALEALDEVEGVDTLNDTHLTIHLSRAFDDDEATQSVVRLLLDSECLLRSLGHVEPSLDDIYLKLVRSAHMTLWLLFTDELKGFYKSKIMAFLWVGLPLLVLTLQLWQPDSKDLSFSALSGMVVSSIAGSLGAVMLAVSIINEKANHVYDLFLIRPLKRRELLLSKFLAVFGCIALACVLANGFGLGIDWLSHGALPPDALQNTLETLGISLAVLLVSCAAAFLIGVVTPSVLLGVILVIYGANNIAVLPMLPVLLKMESHVGLTIWATALALSAALLWASIAVFNRQQF